MTLVNIKVGRPGEPQSAIAVEKRTTIDEAIKQAGFEVGEKDNVQILYPDDESGDYDSGENVDVDDEVEKDATYLICTKVASS